MSRHLGGLVGFNPSIDSPTSLGLSGTHDSIGYRVGEIEQHVHSRGQSFGATSASIPTLFYRSLLPITVTAGDTVYGTEIILHRGTTIEGGSATKYFDMHWLKLTAIGTANRVAIYAFNSFDIGTPKVAALVAGTDKVTDATNTVANGDKIYFASIASNTGVTIYEVYFVINRAAGNFEVSRTLAGAKADITGADGACSYVSLGASDANGLGALQTIVSDELISRAAAQTDSTPSPIHMDREKCNRMISCRGISAAGGNSVSFYVGLHTYPS